MYLVDKFANCLQQKHDLCHGDIIEIINDSEINRITSPVLSIQQNTK
jgi:hypothetical protein